MVKIYKDSVIEKKEEWYLDLRQDEDGVYLVAVDRGGKVIKHILHIGSRGLHVCDCAALSKDYLDPYPTDDYSERIEMW